MSATAVPPAEQRGSFACFGSRCTVIVADADPAAARRAVTTARRRLLGWHEQFSRFLPASELTRLNEDPRETVPVSPLMRRVLEAAVQAAGATGGLVDPTLLGEVERAGYGSHFEGEGVPLASALARAPARRPGRAAAEANWRLVRTDRRSGTATRPPGVRIDPGGVAKGVFADELVTLFGGHAAVVVDCGGDLRLGGRDAPLREVHVSSPFDDAILHTFTLRSGGVATSGIGRRSWVGVDGRVAHHLLDPGSGAPAFTGVVQVTAVAPNATEAEALSKAALLRGPARAGGELVHGGVIVLDDGSFVVLDPASVG